MRAHLHCLGMWNPQIPGDPGHYRWHYIIETVTGLIDHIIDDSFVPDGDYDLPDSDWTFDTPQEVVNGENLFCSTAAQ